MPISRWLIPETNPLSSPRTGWPTRYSAGHRQRIGKPRMERPGRRPAVSSGPNLEHLHDPLLLTGMRDAVTRIKAAIQAKEKILIYGDYDVDGTVSVVILKKAIEMAGGEASFHVPHRLKDGYGMRSDVIERAAAMGIALIISVDTGIRASEVVREARDRGIDVIVTDHHLPDAELPPALAVLNPNRRDCRYPDKNLCGAGVAFKLVHALLATLGWPAEKLARVMKSFLKLVAIATVADVVPLVGENRIIVKHGLEGLNQSKNPGLRAILELSGLMNGRSPSARQVAFQIAPRINAAGRMDDAQNVIRMFLTDDPEYARRLASELHSLNQERRDTEAEIVRLVLEECAGVPVTDDQTVLVFSGPQLASRRGGDRRQPLSGALLPAGVRAERRRRPGARLGTQHRAVSSCWTRWNPCPICLRVSADIARRPASVLPRNRFQSFAGA